mmetsp:Transcript_80938/g.241203  ORF Transcript_80938/g.241203 Transcript_80938/m.241203 type:complete len:250 (-) Transcript_80938:121-870(-)
MGIRVGMRGYKNWPQHSASAATTASAYLLKSSERTLGLACSKTRPRRESMVLSMVMLPFWHASTTPPRQEGPDSLPPGAGGSLTAVSIDSLQVFFEPVSFWMTFEYSSMAGCRQAFTVASSQLRHLTWTSSSKSMSMPWTMSLVMKGFSFASLFSWSAKVVFVSSAILEMTSWRPLIFSRRERLIAVDRAMACAVSICFTLRAYSCSIFSLVEFTTLSFSTLNSCSAFAEISSALSLASLRMNWAICTI